MNNERRKAIKAILIKLDQLASDADEIRGEINDVQDDEQSYYDAMPESLQDSEKGGKSEAAIEQLGEALSVVEDIGGEIDSAKLALEEASS